LTPKAIRGCTQRSDKELALNPKTERGMIRGSHPERNLCERLYIHVPHLYDADGDAYPLDHDQSEDDEEHGEDRECNGDVF
jgi:hypothetical protein